MWDPPVLCTVAWKENFLSLTVTSSMVIVTRILCSLLGRANPRKFLQSENSLFIRNKTTVIMKVHMQCISEQLNRRAILVAWWVCPLLISRRIRPLSLVMERTVLDSTDEDLASVNVINPEIVTFRPVTSVVRIVPVLFLASMGLARLMGVL